MPVPSLAAYRLVSEDLVFVIQSLSDVFGKISRGRLRAENNWTRSIRPSPVLSVHHQRMKNYSSAPARAKFVKFGHKLSVNNDWRNGSLLLLAGFIFLPHSPGTGAEGGLGLHSSDGQLRQAQADNLIDNFSNTCKQGVQAQDKCYQPFFSVFALIVFAIQNPDCNDRNQS